MKTETFIQFLVRHIGERRTTGDGEDKGAEKDREKDRERFLWNGSRNFLVGGVGASPLVS
jgi:hypothetical protein